MFYDYLVQRRNRKVVSKAEQTNTIVSALFPSNVRDRILKDAEEQAQLAENDRKNKILVGGGQKEQLKTFLGEDEDNTVAHPFGTKPIADLFVSPPCSPLGQALASMYA